MPDKTKYNMIHKSMYFRKDQLKALQKIKDRDGVPVATQVRKAVDKVLKLKE